MFCDIMKCGRCIYDRCSDCYQPVCKGCEAIYRLETDDGQYLCYDCCPTADAVDDMYL